MKSYNKHQQLKPSMSMPNDPKLKDTLKKLFSENPIDFLIETGTYLGAGSTKMIAEAFPPGKKPKEFSTIEVNYNFYRKAAKNLKEFDFVKVLWGNSVSLEEALDFMQQDEAILHHKKFANLFIDYAKAPIKFYEKEIKGYLKMHIIKRFLFNLAKPSLKPKENLLRKLLDLSKDKNPFIILDSAGGIGYLEYKIVKETMGSRNYWLLLDDINHLKHFRSFEEIKFSSDFEIIDYSYDYGWLLARHNLTRAS